MDRGRERRKKKKKGRRIQIDERGKKKDGEIIMSSIALLIKGINSFSSNYYLQPKEKRKGGKGERKEGQMKKERERKEKKPSNYAANMLRQQRGIRALVAWTINKEEMRREKEERMFTTTRKQEEQAVFHLLSKEGGEEEKEGLAIRTLINVWGGEEKR